MGLPKRLTDQQMKFAHELVTNEGRITATEAAVRAGYAKESARSRACELQNPKRYPLVVKYMGELRAEYQKKYEVTFEKHITELGKIRQAALDKGAWSAAVNAEVARGKAAGLYIEQKIIRTGKLKSSFNLPITNTTSAYGAHVLLSINVSVTTLFVIL